MLDEEREESQTTDASEEVIIAEPTTDASEEVATETTDASEEAPPEGTVPISELRKLRAENKKYRLQFQEFKEKIAKEKRDAELAEMEETDRLKAIAAEAEAKVQALKMRADTVAKKAAIISQAASMNFHDPQFVADAMPLSEIPIVDGIVDHNTVRQELEMLKEQKSYLIKQEKPEAPPVDFGGGPTSPAPPPGARPFNPKITDASKIAQMREQARKLIREGKVVEANRLQNQMWEMQYGVKKP